MQHKTIRTPLFVQVTFIAFFLVMMTPFLVLIASASPVDCKTEFYNGFFQEITPEVKKQCGKKFEYFTRIEVRRMNNFATFNLNK